MSSILTSFSEMFNNYLIIKLILDVTSILTSFSEIKNENSRKKEQKYRPPY